MCYCSTGTIGASIHLTSTVQRLCLRVRVISVVRTPSTNYYSKTYNGKLLYYSPILSTMEIVADAVLGLRLIQ